MPIVKLLINHGADINAKNERGETPLHLATRYCFNKIVKLLLENGADPNIKDNEGKTPLDLAREMENDPRARVRAVVRMIEEFANK